MSQVAADLRHSIREALLSRAYFTDELAHKIGITTAHCQAIIHELRQSGEPVQPGEMGRWLIAYPKGRKCEVCGCFLSYHNPYKVCALHSRTR